MSTPRWPWYYHLILVVFCFAMSVVYTRINPGHREARIALVVAAVLFVLSVVAIQWQKRRRIR
jgi:ACR3 family arsenite efflux pump ArsB